MQNREFNAKLVEFIQRYCETDKLITRSYDGEPVMSVSLRDLAQYNNKLLDDLIEQPDEIIKYFEQTIQNYEDLAEYAIDTMDDVDVSLVTNPADRAALPPNTKLEFTDPTTDMFHDIGDPRNDRIGQLVAMEGLCKQSSDNSPRVMETMWVCQRCGAQIGPVDVSDTFKLDNAKPHECSSCERQGPFERNTNQERREEYQQIKIQEPPGDAVDESQPREIVADAIGVHHIDQVRPGDRATVVGILREDSDNESTLLDTRLEIMSIIPEEVQFEEVQFEQEDIDQIQQIAAKDNLFEVLSNSVAASIYGRRYEKLAAVLMLFGGVTKRSGANRKRGEIHVMFIGDPGTAKSQLLQATRQLAPRAVSASGTGSSKVGMTASAQKEEIGGEQQWTLQAGALVLADGGLITIDELDNQRHEDQQGLDEALSEGEIKVDKANVHARLKTRCSALMAANPEQGRFEPFEPLNEQFDMPEELLDRCDLIFPFEDKPDHDTDGNIADAILGDFEHAPETAADGGPEAPIQADLFQKYVAYARRNYDPMLTEDAKGRIKDWYLELRGMSELGQISLNTRMLQAARRLSQASARARLSETVSEADTDRAIELIMHMLNELGLDEDGQGYDVDMVLQGKASPTQRDRIRNIKTLTEDLEAAHEDGAPIKKIVAQANEEFGMEPETVEEEIEKLRRKGEVYEPKADHLRTS